MCAALHRGPHLQAHGVMAPPVWYRCRVSWGVAALLRRGLRQHAWSVPTMAQAASVWRDHWPHHRRRAGGMWSIGRPWSNPVEAFLVSTGVVALGEIGDKTQL